MNIHVCKHTRFWNYWCQTSFCLSGAGSKSKKPIVIVCSCSSSWMLQLQGLLLLGISRALENGARTIVGKTNTVLFTILLLVACFASHHSLPLLNLFVWLVVCFEMCSKLQLISRMWLISGFWIILVSFGLFTRKAQTRKIHFRVTWQILRVCGI